MADNAIPTAMTPVELEYVTCPNCKSEIMKVYYLNVPVTTQPALCPVCDYPIGSYCHEYQIVNRVEPISIVPEEVIKPIVEEPAPPVAIVEVTEPVVIEEVKPEVEPITIAEPELIIDKEKAVDEVTLPVAKPIPWTWIAIGILVLIILARR